MKKAATDSMEEATPEIVAICCFCGQRKSEAFDACCKCGLAPRETDDLILSSLLNSVFTELDQLKKIGKGISKGKRPGMSSEVRAIILEMLENEGILSTDERE